MRQRAVDIFILSGFLGSGKSTLLKQLLQVEKRNERKIGVLMNELGEVSVDSSIIPNDTPLKEMLNGCICCTIQGELSLQLTSLLEEHDLDAIYIEATGVAHPLEVIDACTHPLLAGKVEIKAVITVINAIQWHEGKMSIKLRKLMKKQAEYADLVLINKTDQVNESVIEMVKKNVQEVNQWARILPVMYANIDPSMLYSSENRSTNRFLPQEVHDDSHIHKHLHLRTITVPMDRPIDRVQFVQLLKKMNRHLFRAKGFIQLKETPGIFLFNYSYGEPMFERCEKHYEPILVFIGDDELERSKIEKELFEMQNIGIGK
ncbi:CobW family GTP-binding protein [Desertibacillus haloalkaliphilus]|uniref:CobW family GTP-binding protein n=1 Tax=Desertibacillus haloalkaliphilus TaxID=1328930 RepID=UPI001C26D512|nr:GTP-binding protein [Desertibacillus haloalkaliphilus]MBU8905347.1 GTP-binding protein [Desertibacillus haloalkaliphilus]